MIRGLRLEVSDPNAELLCAPVRVVEMSAL
jgi:hypothetical protein